MADADLFSNPITNPNFINPAYATPAQIAQQREYAKYLMTEGQQPVRHWTQGLSNVLASALGGYEQGKANRAEYAAMQTGAKQQEPIIAALLGQQPPGMPSAAPMGDTAPGGLPGRIIQAESGGQANPPPTGTTTAGGPGQFIDATWLSTIKKARPDLAAGKTDAQLLALKTDPKLAEAMTGAYAADNQTRLASAGLPTGAGPTYLAHFAGPEGARKVLSSPPATPVTALLSPEAIKTNPFLANMTAGDLRAWADKKMGAQTASAGAGGPSGATPTSSQGLQTSPGAAAMAPGGASPQAAGLNPAQVAAILQNPWIPGEQKAALMHLVQPQVIDIEGGKGIFNPVTRQIQPLISEPKFGTIKLPGGLEAPVVHHYVNGRWQSELMAPGGETGAPGVKPAGGPLSPLAPLVGQSQAMTATGEATKAEAGKAVDALDKYKNEAVGVGPKLALLNKLDEVSDQIGKGGAANKLKAFAAEYGVPLGPKDKVGEIELYNAIVRHIAPTQGTLASARMSPVAAEWLMGANPQVWQEPDVRRNITAMLRTTLQFQQKAGQIAIDTDRPVHDRYRDILNLGVETAGGTGPSREQLEAEARRRGLGAAAPGVAAEAM